MKPTRAQLEIGLLVAGTLAILIMYRNYLQRALALQEQRQSDLASVLADARSGPPASAYQNGVDALKRIADPPMGDDYSAPREYAEWLREQARDALTADPDLARRAAEQPPHADA